MKKLWLLPVIFLQFALGLAGVGKFMPNAVAVQTGGVAAIACGLVVAILVVLDMRRQVEVQPWLGLAALFIALSVGSVIGYLCLNPLIEGLPALYSRSFGRPAERSVRVTGWEQGRGACHGPLVDEIPPYLSNLCFYPPLPKGTTLTLQGRESGLGFYVEHILVVGAAP
jgi:hypothetical protein